MVASNCSGNAQVVRDCLDGLLFPVGDCQALKKAVFSLLDNPIRCKAFAENAATITQRYGPEKVYGLWDSLILAK